MKKAIEIKGLTKEFYQAKGLFKRKKNLILDNLSLEVEKNEIFCLVGPNGAGKTTLLKILSTLILPTRGEANIFGFDVVREGDKIKGLIGLATSDERSFFWRLSGRENLLFFAMLYSLNRVMAKNRVREVMDIVEIEELDKRFQEYSTGMKHRLAVARSLLNDPQLLFMDEPTRSLDPIAAENLRNFIKDKLVKKYGKTIFFTTHQLNEAERLADRLAIIDKGIIKAIGRLEELKAKLPKPDPKIEEVFSFYVNS